MLNMGTDIAIWFKILYKVRLVKWQNDLKEKVITF